MNPVINVMQKRIAMQLGQEKEAVVIKEKKKVLRVPMKKDSMQKIGLIDNKFSLKSMGVI